MKTNIVVLVHPGSLIAAKEEVGFCDFDGIRMEVLSVPPENRFLVTGGLIPEEEYQITRELAALAKEVNPPICAEPDDKSLARAAKKIWKGICTSKGQNHILITGAWGDPDNGCATHVHNTLIKLGADSTLSDLCPVFFENEEE